MIELDASIIVTGLEAGSWREVVEILCGLMQEEGYIGADYCGQVIQREELYPTGLPSEGAMAAIPHAVSDDVFKTGTAVAVLKHSVAFMSMADREESLPVEIVFLMANAADSEAHLTKLQELMDCLSRPRLMEALKHADSPENVQELLRRADDYIDDHDF